MKTVKLVIILILSYQQMIRADDSINNAKTFLSWLDLHKDEWIKCSPQKINDGFELCDKTFINQKLLKNLFSMSADDLVSFIRSEKINLKIFCHPEDRFGAFEKYCISNTQNSAQKKAQLQGQYHPDTNTIDIQSNANRGSLIHEYIHFLQFKNDVVIFGKKYKSERASIQEQLVKSMTEGTDEVEKLFKEKKESAAKIKMSEVLKSSEELMKFSFWQDAIDEKNIFLLFLKFGNEFGIREEDVNLARKNMGFICKRINLPDTQCESIEEVGLKNIVTEIEQFLKEIRPDYNKEILSDFFKNLPEVNPALSIEDKIKKINDYFFNQLNIIPDRSYLSRNNEENFLPDSALKLKKAHCLGLTILYLMAAEKLNIKAFFVRAPGHVFPRLCDDKKCMNIEVLKSGEIVSDQFFIDNLFITKNNREDGQYLKNLSSTNEILASLYSGLAFVAGTKKAWGDSEILYKKSIDLSRGVAESYSNLAAIYFQQKKIQMAKTYLDIALKINPELVTALVNRGAMAQSIGDVKTANDYYDKALSINPTIVEAYRRKAKIYLKQQNFKDAYINLEKILIVEPKFCDVLKDQLSFVKNQKTKELKLKALNKLENNHECLELPL